MGNLRRKIIILLPLLYCICLGNLSIGECWSDCNTLDTLEAPIDPDSIVKCWSGRIDLNSNFSKSLSLPANSSKSIRVTAISKDAEMRYPVFFVVRQQKSILSWALPYVIQPMNAYVYDEVSHTLCPEDDPSDVSHKITLDVSTSALTPVNFTIYISDGDFQLRTHVPKTFVVSPSKPKYYRYIFSEDDDVVLVKISSTSSACTVISVQPAQCPVYDQHHNVEFVGQYQSMTKQAAITVQKSSYPDGQFFLVAVVQPSDNDCLGQRIHYVPLKNLTLLPLTGIEESRIKDITVTVDTILPVSEYWKPILATIGVLFSFYLVTGVIMLAHHCRTKDQNEGNLEEQEMDGVKNVKTSDKPTEENSNDAPFAQSQSTPSYNYGAAGNDLGNAGLKNRPLQRASEMGDDSDENDIDMLDDIAEEKEIYRTKMAICVADLSRKKPKTLDRKYKLYYWNLLAIAVFYGLPAVQLVVTYQAVLNMSGNEDMCYYNFLCALPGGQISAFNNVFSNMGYMMLGFLYLLIVWRKHHIHNQAVKSGSERVQTRGIPKHFGVFYALGFALVMEGVLSGSYHVCPNYSNFQFDTAFMYIIAGLGMIVLYQQRHPDVNANAYAAFATFAAVIFIAFMGVVFVSTPFYIIFAVLHVITCLAVSTQIYYMGTWKLDFGMFKRAFIVIRTELCRCARPVYIDRMIVLILGNAVNWSIMIYGLVKMPKDFNSFLLAIFLVNLVLYTAFYIIMKLRSGEKLKAAAIVIMLASLVFWGLALKFYFVGLTGWEKTAALSRESNAPCILMGFFDDHDVWHFLSAGALFFSFLLVLLMDEDLNDIDRQKIAVF